MEHSLQIPRKRAAFPGEAAPAAGRSRQEITRASLRVAEVSRKLAGLICLAGLLSLGAVALTQAAGSGSQDGLSPQQQAAGNAAKLPQSPGTRSLDPAVAQAERDYDKKLAASAPGFSPVQTQNDAASGGIRGTVVDPHKKPVEAASVVAVNNSTGKTILVRSNEAGEFYFGSLPPGTYTVTISAPGLATYTLQKLQVEAGRVSTADVKMNASGAPERVEETSRTVLPGYQVGSEAASGLQTTTFTTPQGRISVNLTDDLAAGDTMTGTVEEQPAGRDDAEREQNQGELRGYVVQIEEGNTPVGQKTFTRKIPATLSPAGRTISLIKDGVTVAAAEFPVSAAPPPAPTVATWPTGGQQGKNLVISEPCNGVFDGGDSVRIGDTTVPEIAESPRKKVVRNTSTTMGPTELVDTENGRTTIVPFRNIGIRLSAPNLHLLKRQKTVITTEVTGLGGITKAVPLDLVDDTPIVISMSGGNVQKRMIQPSQVDTSGTYSQQNTVTGLESGGFGVTGTVTWNEVYTSPIPRSTPESAAAHPGTALPPATTGSAPVGNPPTEAEINKARQAVSAARQKVDVAQQMLKLKLSQEADAWSHSTLHIPDDLMSEYEKARKAKTSADASHDAAHDKWLKTMGDSFKQGSAGDVARANQAKLGAAEEVSRKANDAYYAAQKAVIDRMTPGDQKKWKDAHEAALGAAADVGAAQDGYWSSSLHLNAVLAAAGQKSY